MIELGRSKKARLDISSGGKDNAGFASSDEKPSINGLVAPADSSKATVNSVATNGSIVHRRSMPGVVTSSPEMIAFRPVTNEYWQAPSTNRDVANAYSSDASAMACAKSAPPALDQQTAGNAAVSTAEDAKKRINVDSTGLSRAPSAGRDTRTKSESDDPDKSPVTTIREPGSVDSSPSHSVHRSRRSGSSRREKHRRTRHSSSPDSRRRPSPPKCEPAGNESATAF